MPIFAVQYRYSDDTAGLDQHRPEHRRFLDDHEAFLLAGRFQDEPLGALLLVRVADADAATALLDADPYHREGLIAERTIRPYNPALGTLSSAFAD